MKISQFFNLFNQGEIDAKSHMKNLIEMAMADGHLDERESELIRRLSIKYEISDEDLENIEANPEEIIFDVPKSKRAKFKQLYDLVHMMIVDKYVDKREMNLCAIFAKKMGYSEKFIDKILSITTENIKHNKSMNTSLKQVIQFI